MFFLENQQIASNSPPNSSVRQRVRLSKNPSKIVSFSPKTEKHTTEPQFFLTNQQKSINLLIILYEMMP